MMWDLLLALGLLLSMAPQLRPQGLPIGPGEICLVIWLVPMLGREAARLGPPLTPAFSRLFIFWVLFGLGQSLGALTGLLMDDKHDAGLFMHDVIAYMLVALVSCLSVVEPGAEVRLRRVAWFLSTLGAASLVLQFANAGGLFQLPTIDPWYWDRMRGWSANPNQLALLSIVLGFLSFHLAETAAGQGRRIAAIGCALPPLLAGLFSGSDTFILVVLAGLPLLAVLKLRAWLLPVEKAITLRFAAACIAILVLPLALAAAIPLGISIAGHAEDLTDVRPKEGRSEEASLRFELWKTAIQRGLQSGMLGLGPGPHLEIPPSIARARLLTVDEPVNIQHPTPNMEPNFEAHNTLLDLFTQGGLIVVLSSIWLGATAFWFVYRARLAALAALLCGLGLFSIFHLIVRYPIFWFVIALCLVAGDRAARAFAIRERS
jgi:hypothetical protein